MKYRSRRALPVPLGELLENGLSATRENSLWQRIAARRRPPQPNERAQLPLPLGRALVSSVHDPVERAKVWRAVQARRQRRPGSLLGPRLLMSGAMGGVVVALAAWLLVTLRPDVLHPLEPTASKPPPLGALTLANGRPLETVESRDREQELVLADLSRIRLAPGTRLLPLVSTDSRLDFLLERGSANFAVTPGGPRRWTIAAGAVRVEVVGTEFSVLRNASLVEVSVAHGIVLVSGAGVPDGVKRLTAGQQLRVDVVQPVAQAARPKDGVSALATEAAASAQVEVRPRSPGQKRGTPRHSQSPLPPPVHARAEEAQVLPTPIRLEPKVSPTWRSELQARRYDVAYASLGELEFARVVARSTTPEELLDLADVARLSGHPREAVGPLTRLLDQFAHSPHAAVAAFTLGRTLLDQLHDARGAANAFERAIGMHPPRALLEDCHARLVQAYLHANARDEAEAAAKAYRAIFPEGRHLKTLEHWMTRASGTP